MKAFGEDYYPQDSPEQADGIGGSAQPEPSPSPDDSAQQSGASEDEFRQQHWNNEKQRMEEDNPTKQFLHEVIDELSDAVEDLYRGYVGSQKLLSFAKIGWRYVRMYLNMRK